jgi:hypothetical protein
MAICLNTLVPPPADNGVVCRQLAVKNGATIHGVAKVAKHGVASQQQTNPAEGSARIDARIARQSYGAWMGDSDEPMDLVKWFITKVR